MTKSGMIVLLAVQLIVAAAWGSEVGPTQPAPLDPLNFGVVAIIAPNGEIRVGDTSNPAAKVKNFGTVEDSAWCWVRIEHTCSTDIYVDSCWLRLGAGRETTVTFRPWTPLYPGLYRIQFTFVRNDTHWLYFTVLGGGGVRESPLHPGLTQNGISVQPNPVLSSALIRYSVATETQVELRVFDAGGGVVRTLFAGNSAPGEHSVAWDAHDDQGRPVSSGIYFVSLETPQQKLNRKLVLSGGN